MGEYFNQAQDKNGQVIYKYNQEQSITTPPHLAAVFQPSDSWQTIFWDNSQGHTLRVGISSPQSDPKGILFSALGASEFMENDFEFIREINDLGFTVITFDPFGQGCSDRRHPDHRYALPKPFTEHGQDIAEILQEIVHPWKNEFCPDGSLVGLGKSQGANHLLHALHANPDHGLDRLILGAPMLGHPAFTRYGRFGLVTPYARILELSEVFRSSVSPADQEYNPGKFLKSVPLPLKYNDPRSFQTEDKARRRLRFKWIRENPQLANSIFTSGWIRRAFEGCRTIQSPEVLKQIDIPTLLLKATRDQIVCNPSIELVHAKLPNSHLIEINGTHDLLMEDPTIRGQVIQASADFVHGKMDHLLSPTRRHANDDHPRADSTPAHSESEHQDLAL